MTRTMGIVVWFWLAAALLGPAPVYAQASSTSAVSRHPTALRINVVILPESEAVRAAVEAFDSMPAPRRDQMTRLTSVVRGDTTETVIAEIRAEVAEYAASLGLAATDTLVAAAFDVRIEQVRLADYESLGAVRRNESGVFEIVGNEMVSPVDVLFAENHLRNLQRARAEMMDEIRRQVRKKLKEKDPAP